MASSTTPTAADVRAWAREHGFTVGARGRLAKDVIDAFNARRRNKYVVGTA